MNGQALVIAMLSVMALMCASAAVGYLIAGRPGMALAFAGYVAANAGFILDLLRK